MDNTEKLRLMINEFKEKIKLYNECCIGEEDINILEKNLKERQQDKDKIKELEKENTRLKKLVPAGFYPDINTDYLKK